jgi:Na+/H+-translocating membrane pyrophosphatase
VTAIASATFFINIVRAWDNAKKYGEAGNFGGNLWGDAKLLGCIGGSSS